MGTKASIYVIEVSVKRMPANGDLFLDLQMSHSPIVSWADRRM